MKDIVYKFEKLQVWQISLELSDLVYDIIKMLPKEEEFNLKSQMRRAVTSISLNIAEGSTTSTNKEQSNFLKIALRSAIEVIACLKIIEQKSYIEPVNPVLRNTYEKANLEFGKLSAFLESLK